MSPGDGEAYQMSFSLMRPLIEEHLFLSLIGHVGAPMSFDTSVGEWSHASRKQAAPMRK